MTPAPYPSLELRFTVAGVDRRALALVDTGFDGHLAVPEALITGFPRPAYRHRVQTASGEIVRVPVYLGTVELVDQPKPIDALIIALGDEYLLGISTINHFKLTFDHGVSLTVEP